MLSQNIKMAIRKLILKHPEKAIPIFQEFYREFTAEKRVLPNFLIIGAQRCGTTSLYDYISEHPNMIPSPVKELYYFNDNFDKGLNWYKEYFPLKSHMKKDYITGEATPNYLFNPYTAERVKKTIPNVKLIVLLRNPIERAYSHYNFMKKLGQESLSFEEALNHETERISSELNHQDKTQYCVGHNLSSFSYRLRGLYAEQLSIWLKHFPREQFLFIQSEKFYKNTAAEYWRVIEFLELPKHNKINFKQLNEGKYLAMAPKLYDSLKEFYQTKNQDLFDLIGEKYDW